jgi:hypothetical protein
MRTVPLSGSSATIEPVPVVDFGWTSADPVPTGVSAVVAFAGASGWDGSPHAASHVVRPIPVSIMLFLT